MTGRTAWCCRVTGRTVWCCRVTGRTAWCCRVTGRTVWGCRVTGRTVWCCRVRRRTAWRLPGVVWSELLLFVSCLTPQQQASVSQGRICSDNFTCCHTEIEVADQTFYPTQSQYTDTGPTSPSADPITPGAWQGSHLSANF